MSQRRILSMFGIAFAAMGLVSLSLCIFRQGEDQILLRAGLMCNSIAFVLHCVANRKKR